MNIVTKGLEPARVLSYFEEISAIPRGSGNEKGIADYLENFAKAHGLFCYRDELHNIMIKKRPLLGMKLRKRCCSRGIRISSAKKIMIALTILKKTL